MLKSYPRTRVWFGPGTDTVLLFSPCIGFSSKDSHLIGRNHRRMWNKNLHLLFHLYAIIFLSSSGISYVYIFSLHMSSSGDCIDSCDPRSGPPFHPQIYIFDFTPDISTWIAVGHLIFTRFIDDINIYSPNLFILLVFPISVQAPLATFIPRRRRRRKKAATFFKI